MEAWVNPTATSDQVLFSQYEDGSNRWYLRLDLRDASRTIGFYDIDGAISIETSNNTWPSRQQWVHMAFVRSSGVITTYIDGSAVTLKTNTNPSASWGNYAATLQIGAYDSGSALDGYMDEIRISNVARYTADFTPSTTEFTSDSNTKLLIHSNTTMGSTTFTDSGANTHTITANGDVRHVAPKIGTGMGAFDGTSNDYLTIGSGGSGPVALTFSTGNFTVETWLCLTQVGAAQEIANCGGADWRLTVQSDNTVDWGHTSSLDLMSSTTALAVGTWYHIAISRTGSSNYLFINGTQKILLQVLMVICKIL